MKLKLYLNKIARCLVIVYIICESIKYGQWYILIKFDTIFKSQLSTDYNKVQNTLLFKKKRVIYNPNKNVFLDIYWPFGVTVQAMFDIYDQTFEAICTPSDQISDKNKEILNQFRELKPSE